MAEQDFSGLWFSGKVLLHPEGGHRAYSVPVLGGQAPPHHSGVGERMLTSQPQVWAGPSACHREGRQSRGNVAQTPFQTHPADIRKWD